MASNLQKVSSQESETLAQPIKPGYRRQSRTPSPGNSPARRPLSVATAEAPREEQAVLSATTATPESSAPEVPSTIPRAESPTKGTVRDLADKLEKRSSTSSPVGGVSSVADVQRPSDQRLESFRPSLPGGWNSYSTTPGTPSPTQSTENLPREPTTLAELMEEDIPTAGPPRPREAGYETSGKAFEALAAAGSALSGAFGAMTRTSTNDSSEAESPMEVSTEDSTPAKERPGNLSPVQEVLSNVSSVPPTPPAKDGPYEQPGSKGGYFPSPLRTSKTSDASTPTKPQMLPALSTDNSPHDTESDRLRKEIVRSLTPKSAKGQAELPIANEHESLPKSAPLPRSEFDELDEVNLPSRESTGDWGEAVKKELAHAGTGAELPALPHEDNVHQQAVKESIATTDRGAVLPPPPAEPEVRKHVVEPEEHATDEGPAINNRPTLQKRFSWEASSGSIPTLARTAEVAAAPAGDPQVIDIVDSPRTIKASGEFVRPMEASRSVVGDEDEVGVQEKPTMIPVAKSNEPLQNESPNRSVEENRVDDARGSVEGDPVHEPSAPYYSPTEPSGRPSMSVRSVDQAHESPAEPSGRPSMSARSFDQARESSAEPFGQPSVSARSFDPAQESPTSASPPPPPVPKDLSFREILGMKTPQERIRAYNTTRQQLSSQDSGLSNWLQTTGSQFPEHHDLLNRNGRFTAKEADYIHSHKPSPSRSKFPRFGASLGGTSLGGPPVGGSDQTSYPEMIDQPKISPSGGKITSQQMQEEGKKLLQSAGKFGGKAGGAAKGLFAKGKSKFRASSGGGEKVDT
jgi:hypothetical protein